MKSRPLKTISSPSHPTRASSNCSGKGWWGRTWLVEAIEKWRNAADRASRLFWIMGAPGVGKSAFAAHLAHYGRDKVIAVQFCEYDKPDHRSAHRIVRTLAFQIATRLPDYRKLLLTLPEIKDLDRMNPTELFDYLLTNPLHNAIDGGRERYLIVIDALDEAGGNGHNELVEMLARSASRLPEWIGIVVTSRPENAVIAPLQGLNPFILDTATESNRADIRDYLRRELASHLQNRPDADRLIEQILEKSEGVFLYVERFCEDVQRGHLSLDRPEQFPQGLGGIFFQYFQRQFPDLEKFRNGVRPALRAILAAREPLPWKYSNASSTGRTRNSVTSHALLPHSFRLRPRPAMTSLSLTTSHWQTGWADEAKACDYSVSVKEGHAFLAESSVRAIKSRAEPISVYWLRHALYHLQQCRRASDAAEVAADKWFIDLRIQSGLKNIFLSYSLDATETADRLFADLSRFGHTVLRHANEGANDAQNPASSADMIIALLTRRSTRMRSWSYRETLEAVSQGKVVLPVRATSSELTMPFHLRRPRYIDLSADYVGGLNELCQTLGKSSEIEKYCEDDATDLLPLEELVAQALRLSSEGRLVESEPLYRRALTTVEQNVGADHVDVCQRLEDLGQLLFSTNRLAEAEPLMRRALAIYEKTYGKSHPTVATALNNIAYLLQITNRLAEAEPLMRRAMKIDEQSLGRTTRESPHNSITLLSCFRQPTGWRRQNCSCAAP